MGMTSKYDEFVQSTADHYINEFQVNIEDEVVPSITALAFYIGISRSTAYEWAEKYPDFSDTLERINQVQEIKLINGSLANRLNSNIAKLMLANHGYSDHSIVDNNVSVNKADDADW